MWCIYVHLCKCITVKPVLGGHSKIDKTKILMTNSSLMQVESIAECSRILHRFYCILEVETRSSVAQLVEC